MIKIMIHRLLRWNTDGLVESGDGGRDTLKEPWCWGVQRHESCILFPGL